MQIKYWRVLYDSTEQTKLGWILYRKIVPAIIREKLMTSFLALLQMMMYIRHLRFILPVYLQRSKLWKH